MVKFLFAFLLSTLVFAQGPRFVKGIELPTGYERIQYANGSYPEYLRGLPLKSNTEILKYDGKILRSSWILYDVLAVLDMPLLYQEDLEQCADFSMRLWSEYLKSMDSLNQLALFDYNGNSKLFRESGKSFRSYLRWHMAFSNSYSIKQGADVVAADTIQPGDMFVQNTDGGIGHVSVIMDAAVNPEGLKIFLIGFGYMPAQEFHIETADGEQGVGGWFTLEGYLAFLGGMQFKSYGTPALMRY